MCSQSSASFTAHAPGHTRRTLDRKRTISVTDWNDAVRAAEEDLAG
jgi:hypothetical protein